MPLFPNWLAGRHHARHLRPDVPYHVISRTFQGRHLLRPCPELNAIIVGVLGRARRLYPDLRIYAVTFLSNHAHFMLRGPTRDLPRFIAYVKREVSSRWGKHPSVRWKGTMWEPYKATALPTAESQVACLRYILSQGVKEGLVERPEEWPGVHCAHHLMTGEPMSGTWFDGTRYAKDVDTQSRTRSPRQIDPKYYRHAEQLTLDPLEAWHDVPAPERQRRVRRMVTSIVREGMVSRDGKPVLGAARVCATPLERITPLPHVPWLHRRRAMIAWADPQAAETKRYVAGYWAFQEAFRRAADSYLAGHTEVEFPPGAFRPIVLNSPIPAAAA